MRKRLFLGGTIILIAIGVLVIHNFHRNRAPLNVLPPTQVYIDPDNYFSIQVPVGWKIQRSVGDIVAQGAPQAVEYISLRSVDGIDVGIQVYERKPSCQIRKNLNTTLAGLPAYYDKDHGSWLLETVSATFNINYFYPGAPIISPVSPMASADFLTSGPVAHTDINTSQRIIDAVIKSFHPKDSQSLQC